MSSEAAAPPEDDSGPDIPDRKLTNPFLEGTPMWEIFEEVLVQERDIVIIIDDFLARRGTGKSVASLQLANGMDQNHGVTKEKVSMDPIQIREAYSSQPLRSGLVLDEGEVGASNRQAMTKVNQALREIMSMGRIEQKFVVVNTPAREFIDKDVQKLADVWITMMRKGEGLVHFLERQPYANGKLLTPKQQWIEFRDIAKDHDLRDVYNHLTAEKRRRIRGSDGGGWMEYEEHREELEKQKKQVAKTTRDDIIRNLWGMEKVQQSALTQGDIGTAAGITQQAVSNIVNPN